VLSVVSEFQARAEVESVPRDAIADIEVVNSTRTKVEVTFASLGGVGSNRAYAKGAADKALQSRGCAFVFVDLLNPALNEANSETILEAFDRRHFQVGQKSILIKRSGILCVEFHLPNAGQLDLVTG